MTPDFTDQDGVLRFLSPFWTRSFPDKGFSRGMASTHAAMTLQVHQDSVEFINSASIETAPLYHREIFVPVRLLESSGSIGPLPIAYGEGILYGDQPAGTIYREGDIFEYGGAERRASFYYWSLPSGIHSIGPTLLDRLSVAGNALVEGQDFVSPDGEIVAFPTNPFSDPRFTPRAVTLPDGSETREITLWATNVWVDQNLIYRKFASPFTATKTSSEDLRRFVTALMRLYCGGPSILSLDSFVAACAGQPVSEGEGEIIESIESFGGESLVITDQNVYRVPSGVALRGRISAGTELIKGEPLTTVTQVDDLLSDPTWWTGLVGMTLRPSMQSDGAGALFFPNSQEIAIGGGSASVRFPVLGDPTALESFWSRVDSHGGLGDYLWLKNGVVDENGHQDYSSGTLVNPMQFLVEDLLGNAVIAVRVGIDRVADHRALTKRLSFLDGAVFAGASLAFFIDYSTLEAYDLSTVEETITVARGMGVIEDEVNPNTTESVTPRLSVSRR